MAFTWEMFRKIKGLIGSAADTDIATDIANLDTVVDAVGTNVTSVLADTAALELDSAKSDTPKLASGSISDDTETSVLSVTDKGVLTGITQICSAFTATGNGVMRITIDGEVVGAVATLYFTAAGQSVHYSFNHRFDTSLAITHWVNAASKGTLYTIVTYTTD